MSKGSTPRPFSVSADEYASNWDSIFKVPRTVQIVENDLEGPVWSYVEHGSEGAKDGPTIEGAKASASSITEADRNGGQGAAQDRRAAEGND